MSARPTIRHVAERAGVSVATVSRALNDKRDVSVQTRERVREAARSLGYSADRTARALVTQQTRLVAAVVGDNAGHRDLSLIFFGKVLAAISHRLAQSRYDPLLLQPLDVDPHQRFDAAILIGVDNDDPLVAELAARDVPLVGVDVRCPGKRTAYVGSDHAGGVRLALAHLHVLGHRRIAHVAGAQNTVAGIERLRPFRDEAARLGLDCAPTTSGGRLLLSVGLPGGMRAARALRATDGDRGRIRSDGARGLQAIREAGLEPGKMSRSSGSTTSRLLPSVSAAHHDPPGPARARDARRGEGDRVDRIPRRRRATAVPVELVVQRVLQRG